MTVSWDDNDLDRLWDAIPGTEFMDDTETDWLETKLSDALDISINEHERLDESPLFLEWLDDMNMFMEDFPWVAFREWLEAMYE
jgi:hypothetical protein